MRLAASLVKDRWGFSAFSRYCRSLIRRPLSSSLSVKSRTTQRKPCVCYFCGGGVPELSLAAAAPDDRVASKATGRWNKNGKVLRQFVQLVARGPRARRRARAQAAAGMDEVLLRCFGIMSFEGLLRRLTPHVDVLC